jgi:uncharacterized membrane protein YtjA (UPF0391 family)
MSNGAVSFLIVALVAGVIGFGDFDASGVGIAQVMCVAFAALCAVSMLLDRYARP